MKRILVTGANKGIGLATVERILAEHDDTFALLGSRDRGRGDAARERLLTDHPSWSERLALVEIDVTDDASVRAAAADVAARFAGEPAPLYGIVNNAGGGIRSANVAAVFDLNTYAVRRVCEAFVPMLDPAVGRVVIVSSASGPMFVRECSEARQRFFCSDQHTWAELDAFMQACVTASERGDGAIAALGLGSASPYGLSKACANTYMMMLARQHPQLSINACTPGFIATDLTKVYQGEGSAAELGMKTPWEGAAPTLHLLFGELDGNAWYYGSDAQRSPLHAYRSPGAPPYQG